MQIVWARDLRIMIFLIQPPLLVTLAVISSKMVPVLIIIVVWNWHVTQVSHVGVVRVTHNYRTIKSVEHAGSGGMCSTGPILKKIMKKKNCNLSIQNEKQSGYSPKCPALLHWEIRTWVELTELIKLHSQSIKKHFATNRVTSSEQAKALLPPYRGTQ